VLNKFIFVVSWQCRALCARVPWTSGWYSEL